MDGQRLRNGTRRVEVEWIDSVRQEGWEDEDRVIREASDPGSMICISVGYLIAEFPDCVVLAQSLSNSGSRSRGIQATITIPRVAIVSEPRDLRR